MDNYRVELFVCGKLEKAFAWCPRSIANRAAYYLAHAFAGYPRVDVRIAERAPCASIG